MTISLLMLTAALSTFTTPEQKLQACVQTCHAYNDQPGAELKACIAQCYSDAK